MGGMVGGGFRRAAQLVGLDGHLACQQLVCFAGHAGLPDAHQHVLASDVHAQAAAGVQRIGLDQLPRLHVAARPLAARFALDPDGLAIGTDAHDAVQHTVFDDLALHGGVGRQVGGHCGLLGLVLLLQRCGQAGQAGRRCHGLGMGPVAWAHGCHGQCDGGGHRVQGGCYDPGWMRLGALCTHEISPKSERQIHHGTHLYEADPQKVCVFLQADRAGQGLQGRGKPGP